jgi:ferredoxin
MATITFSSPSMEKDLTVYAVAGSTDKTVLKLAKSNKVPLPFECEDGECGSCVVRVDSLERKPRMSQSLTEKESRTLVEKNLISQQELEEAEVKDMPPAYRLACQFIPRDEDVLVQFSGAPGVAVKPK